MKVKEKFKKMLKWFTPDSLNPNSPEGFRIRARHLIKNGFALDNPYVTAILKRALILEGKENEIPPSDEWDLWNGEKKEQWTLKQINRTIGEKV